jgi:hypothetical protein
MFNPKESAQSKQASEVWRENMDRTLGMSEASLVNVYGPPASVYNLADGSKVMTYQWQGRATAYTSYNYGYAYTTVGQNWCRYDFTLDSTGNVTFWKADGNSCY